MLFSSLQQTSPSSAGYTARALTTPPDERSVGVMAKHHSSISGSKNGSFKHGHRTSTYTSPTWMSWRAMKERCHTPGAADYSRYGGRGIQVCERWRYSFENFLADMGERPEAHTLERKNVNEDYCLENCRWATNGEQATNKRTNVYLTLHGKTQHIRAWAKELGIDHSTIAWRKKHGYSDEEALTAPIMPRGQRGILGLKARGVL